MSNKTMQAAVVTAPGHVRLQRVPIPQPKEKELLVRIEGCGVCGSNLAPWEGRPWFNYPLAPGELGHEGWGRVEAVGPGTTRFAPGDRVTLLSFRAYADFDLAAESAVVKLPPTLDNTPLPGEAVGCAMNVFNRCDIRPGHNVAIVGIGFLGAVLTTLSAKAGARVIAISRRPFALEIARRMGASHCLPLADHAHVIRAVKEITRAEGCDRVIEAVGQQSPLDLAGELTRERGRLIIAGYHQDGLRQINLQLWNWRGFDVINAHERQPRVYIAGMEAAVRAVASGKLNLAPLFTHDYELPRLSDALNAMRERPGSFLKALVRT